MAVCFECGINHSPDDISHCERCDELLCEECKTQLHELCSDCRLELHTGEEHLFYC